MALAGAAGADDEQGGALGEVSAGGEVVNEGAVDVGRAIEVELFQGLGGAKRCASQAQGKLLLLASGDLVLDVEGQGTRCRRVWTRPPGDWARLWVIVVKKLRNLWMHLLLSSIIMKSDEPMFGSM